MYQEVSESEAGPVQHKPVEDAKSEAGSVILPGVATRFPGRFGDERVLKGIEEDKRPRLQAMFRFPSGTVERISNYGGIEVQELIARLRKTLSFRLTIAAILFVVGGIMYAIQPGVEVFKIELKDWANFLGWTMLLELISAVANDLVFVVLDLILGKRAWHLVYAMMCADGPLGFFIWVLLSQAILEDLAVSKSIPEWNALHLFGAFTALALSARKFFQRRTYSEILRSKYWEKLQNVEIRRRILTRLACYDGDDNTEQPKAGMTTEEIVSRYSTRRSQSNATPADTTDESDSTSLELSEDDSENVQMFWRHLRLVSSGVLKIRTLRGSVYITNMKTAKSVGKRVYRTLSQGGRNLVMDAVLKQIFLPTDENGEFVTSPAGQPKSPEELMYTSASVLLDPSGQSRITEKRCVESFLTVYKDFKFLSTSVNDFGVLQASLQRVINIVFWFLMFVLFMATVNVGLAEFIIPLGTIIVAGSFALSSSVSNLCLAMSFVLFMMPYDIGDKVIVGGPQRLGFITFYVHSISLLYTTFRTSHGEIVHYPNHVLYSTPLANHKHSPNATFEINIEFGIETTNQMIHEFVSALKTYALQAKKDDWASVDCFCTGVNPVHNSVGYGIWVSHKGGWQEIPRIFDARTDLNLFLKQYLANRNIKYSLPLQPVSIESAEAGGEMPENSALPRTIAQALTRSPRM